MKYCRPSSFRVRCDRNLSLGMFVLSSMLLFTFEATASCVNADLVEAWIDVYHIHRAGVDKGYGIEIGFELEQGSTAVISAKVTIPAGGLAPQDLNEDTDEWGLFAAKTFDPDTWTGDGYTDAADLQDDFPNGVYTLNITDACSSFNVLLPYFTLSEPNGLVRTLYPSEGQTINTTKPVIITKNDCTDCNSTATEIMSATGDAVEMERDPNITPGTRPNTSEFSSFWDFGNGGSGNEGTAGDISGSGLPAGSYGLGSGVVRYTFETTGGDLDDYVEFYATAFVFDLTLFTVGVATSTTATIDSSELAYEHLVTKPAIPEAAGVELGWVGEFDIEGSDVNDAVLYIPNDANSPVALVDEGGGDFVADTSTYVTRAELAAVRPPTDGLSKYVVLVDGGRAYAVYDFVPLEPDGSYVLNTPLDGATTDQFPTFNVTNSCTNCNALGLWVADVPTDGDTIEADAWSGNIAGTFDIKLPEDFNDVSNGNIDNGLPNGTYFVGTESYNDAYYPNDDGMPPMLVSSTAETDFQYWDAEYKTRASSITVVPEPGVASLQMISLACLGGIAQVRRSRRG